MPAAYDFHIHTTYLRCANETMTVPAIVQRCEGLGLSKIAITDHLNVPETLPKHLQIKQDLADISTGMDIFFGVEANVIDKNTGAVSISQAQIDEAGFELVIGGPHTSYFETPDKQAIIDLQHRLMLAVIENPLIDVLVHPWWFTAREFAPGGPMEWFTDMEQIPDWHAREIGAAAAANDTAVEANWSAIFAAGQYSQAFRESYLPYLATISAQGAKISISTDAHDINTLDGIHPMMDLLESVGITGEKLFVPEHGRRP